jgi:hypothetical protein
MRVLFETTTEISENFFLRLLDLSHGFAAERKDIANGRRLCGGGGVMD